MCSLCLFFVFFFLLSFFLRSNALFCFLSFKVQVIFVDLFFFSFTRSYDCFDTGVRHNFCIVRQFLQLYKKKHRQFFLSIHIFFSAVVQMRFAVLFRWSMHLLCSVLFLFFFWHWHEEKKEQKFFMPNTSNVVELVDDDDDAIRTTKIKEEQKFKTLLMLGLLLWFFSSSW